MSAEDRLFPGIRLSPAPEHGFDPFFAEGIGEGKVKLGMDQKEIIQFDKYRQASYKRQVRFRVDSGKVFQCGLTAVLHPEAEMRGRSHRIVRRCGRAEPHVLVIAPQRDNPAVQVHDRIEHPPAVRTPVDVIPKQVEAVRTLDPQSFQQGTKRLTAPMDIGNGITHGRNPPEKYPQSGETVASLPVRSGSYHNRGRFCSSFLESERVRFIFVEIDRVRDHTP